MNKRFGRLGREEKGFTLIELLAVIVIIGIIAVIAIPLVSNILNKSRSDADVATARQVYDAARLYITSEKNGDFKGNTSVDITDLTSSGYLDKKIYLPSSKEEIKTGAVAFSSDKGQLEGVTLNGKLYSADKVLQVKGDPETASGGGKGN
ncbi:prepilin-type N-terminal cleavage/methylation domain-containing protein [Paenibacillus sp. HJL G12]|uniref:Prepilin-type N-terminal cleavage/methylation domain-containing protein n=2 Tax=Paenibacillus dendrobii TaxID=2691084 RepID=A0A7X3IMF6_9BACL|nr:prepilin-type N-terminal cleavage/methylation domain-containing protein [Paenibacillus dendrobii]